MWRRLQIEDDTALSSYAGTHRVTLPRTRTIGAVELIVQGVNAATSNSADGDTDGEQKDIRASVTNLKVKSGAKVFYESPGISCRNFMTYDTGKLPWEQRTQVGGHSQYALFTMPFWIEPMARLEPFVNSAGEKEDGGGMGLPAPMLTSLDLEIEYAFNQTDATVGFASSGHQIDVAVWLYDKDESNEQLANKQFRVIEHKHDYTSVASGDEKFNLTLDAMKLLRRIYVEAYKVNTAEAGVISDIQVKRNNDEIFQGKWDGIQAANAQHCKLNFVQPMITKSESTDDIIYTRVPNAFPVSQVPIGTDVYDTESITAYANGTITMVNTDATTGYLVWSAQEVPTLAVVDWDLINDLGDLVSQKATSLEIILTNAAASGDVDITEESICRMW